MNLSKKFLTAAVVASALLITGCGKTNIGYVDFQKITEDAPQMKSIMDEGAQKVQELQAEARQLAEKTDLSDEERQKAQADIQRKALGIEQAYTTQVQHKLDEALADMVKAKNIDVVVDSSKNNPLVVLGGTDLTDEVIQKLQ